MKKKIKSLFLASFLMLPTLVACGHTHEYSQDWSFDESHHWREPICGDTEEVIKFGEHEFHGRVCLVCGYKRAEEEEPGGPGEEDPAPDDPPIEEPSEGLAFTPLFESEEEEVPYGYSVAVGTLENETQVAIPRSHRGLPVLEIAEEAFYGCKALTVVAIPDGVERIGNSAFAECPAMTICEIPDSVTELGDNLFAGCLNLKDITLSAKAELGVRMFARCESLTKISLPEGIKILPGETFTGCEKLSEIAFPDTLEEIGGQAFYRCSALAELSLPMGLKKIGDQAFYLCTALEKIILPDALEEVGDQIFYQCTALKEASLGEGCIEVTADEFAGCVALLKVELPKNCARIAEFAFEGCEALTEIHFGGTMSEWENVRKENGWAKDCGKFTIFCSDGNID